jgi:hypothetical protein
MDPADLISILPVTPAVKSFHFLPRQGGVHESLPGQHIRIESLIDGRWAQRSYTLTSPAAQQDHYEITVKREANGLFSRRWVISICHWTSANRSFSSPAVSASRRHWPWSVAWISSPGCLPSTSTIRR